MSAFIPSLMILLIGAAGVYILTAPASLGPSPSLRSGSGQVLDGTPHLRLRVRLLRRLRRPDDPYSLPPELGLLKIICGGLGVLLALLAGLAVPPALVVGAASFLFAAGYIAPDLYFTGRVKARRDQIRAELPGLISYLRTFAGIHANLYEALRLATEGETGLLAQELQGVVRQVEAQRDIYAALRELAGRIGVKEFNHVVYTLEQTQRLGTPLDEALAVLEEGLYRDREVEAQLQVAQMDLKLMVVGMVLLFPALFLSTVAPTMLRIIQEF